MSSRISCHLVVMVRVMHCILVYESCVQLIVGVCGCLLSFPSAGGGLQRTWEVARWGNEFKHFVS